MQHSFVGLAPKHLNKRAFVQCSWIPFVFWKEVRPFNGLKVYFLPFGLVWHHGYAKLLLIVSWKLCCARSLWWGLLTAGLGRARSLGTCSEGRHNLSAPRLMLASCSLCQVGTKPLECTPQPLGKAQALSTFLSAAGDSCPKQAFGLPVTMRHCRTSKEAWVQRSVHSSGWFPITSL